MNNDKTVWIEKYRPDKLDDVVGQEKTVERLKAYVEEGNLPTLLFTGSAGIGKTACAVALGHELYGDSFEFNFSELNASDERGINVVREKIKTTAQTSPVDGHAFKVIFLDEADALTKDAQAALRRTMEKYANNCRFILSCNYASKIIEPIISRCAVFRFSRLNEDDILKQLSFICNKENLGVTIEAFDAILYIAEGDMRKAVNTLQAASIGNSEITKENVHAISVVIDIEFVEKMIDLSLKGKFMESRNKLDELLFDKGYSGDDIINGIFKYLIGSAVPENFLVKMLEQVGEIDFRLTEGSQERIQLSALLAYFTRVETGR